MIQSGHNCGKFGGIIYSNVGTVWMGEVGKGVSTIVTASGSLWLNVIVHLSNFFIYIFIKITSGNIYFHLYAWSWLGGQLYRSIVQCVPELKTKTRENKHDLSQKAEEWIYKKFYNFGRTNRQMYILQTARSKFTRLISLRHKFILYVAWFDRLTVCWW